MNLDIPTCELIFYGPPIAKARPRFSKFGTYDPQHKLNKVLVQEAKNQLPDFEMIRGAIVVVCDFNMPIPISVKSKTKRRDMLGTPHIKKPDLDNFLKKYFDILEGIVYYNDSQISHIHASKWYSEEPRTHLKFYSMDTNE